MTHENVILVLSHFTKDDFTMNYITDVSKLISPTEKHFKLKINTGSITKAQQNYVYAAVLGYLSLTFGTKEYVQNKDYMSFSVYTLLCAKQQTTFKKLA